ncbi:hypothetical protein JOM56_015447 [Amanita muscaria]
MHRCMCLATLQDQGGSFSLQVAFPPQTQAPPQFLVRTRNNKTEKHLERLDQSPRQIHTKLSGVRFAALDVDSGCAECIRYIPVLWSALRHKYPSVPPWIFCLWFTHPGSGWPLHVYILIEYGFVMKWISRHSFRQTPYCLYHNVYGLLGWVLEFYL